MSATHTHTRTHARTHTQSWPPPHKASANPAAYNSVTI